MIFEILSIFAILAVVAGITTIMCRLMNYFEPEWGFIPTAWFVSAWGAVASLGTSLSVVLIIRYWMGI